MRAYQEVQPELKVIRAIVEARAAQNLTQKELAERTGIAQTEISRLEMVVETRVLSCCRG